MNASRPSTHDKTPSSDEATAWALVKEGSILCREVKPPIKDFEYYDMDIKWFRLEKLEKAIVLFDEVIRRFDNDDLSEEIRTSVAEALVKKGEALLELGEWAWAYDPDLEFNPRREEVLALYDEVVQRFGNDNSPDAREQAATALFNKCNILYDQGKHKEANATFDEVVQRFGNDNDPPFLRLRVAESLLVKGFSLWKQGENKEAIATFDEVVQRFGNDHFLNVVGCVVKALDRKGDILEEQGKHKKAKAVQDEVQRHLQKVYSHLPKARQKRE